MNRRHFLYRMGGAAVGGLTLSSLGFPAKSMGLLRPRTSDVQIGAISYSFRQIPASAEEILSYMVELGLNSVELIGSPAEEFAGGPAAPPFPGNWRELTQDERASYRAERDAVDKEAAAWRLSAPMDKFEALGKMYRDAGVDIDILKLGNPGWSDGEIDYAFRAARAVGARGISFEISNEAGERMGLSPRSTNWSRACITIPRWPMRISVSTFRSPTRRTTCSTSTSGTTWRAWAPPRSR